jgi:hypothetical protein
LHSQRALPTDKRIDLSFALADFPCTCTYSLFSKLIHHFPNKNCAMPHNPCAFPPTRFPSDGKKSKQPYSKGSMLPHVYDADPNYKCAVCQIWQLMAWVARNVSNDSFVWNQSIALKWQDLGRFDLQ